MTARGSVRRTAGPVVGVDLGGTKALFVVVDADGGEWLRQRYECRDFDGFDGILERFLGELRGLDSAAAAPGAICVGMAGPVHGRRATLTNLPWTLDADAIARRTGIGQVLLVNDFHAAASGIPHLAASALRTLQAGEPQAGGCRTVVGAGTGLGVATIVPKGDGWQVIAGEGGHVGFAPADELELALWTWLRARGQRVFAERVLSGAGLAAIYGFVCEHTGSRPAPLLHEPDPAAAIATAASTAGEYDAIAALDLFASIYGAFAGDLGLLMLPRGGLYVAGGIAPKVFDARRTDRFLQAFVAKGAHRDLMARIPVHLVLEPVLGAIGAAAIAADALRSRRRAAAGNEPRRS